MGVAALKANAGRMLRRALAEIRAESRKMVAAENALSSLVGAKFICAGTLEERINELNESKKALAESGVTHEEAWLTELSPG